MPLSFRQRIEQGVVLGDGAMGTQLYERGVFINRNYDELNQTDAHLVKAVHRDYVQAGAEVIETNTFGANPVKLGKHGLAEKAFEINRAGAQNARRCADEGAGVLVAGSIGPLGKPIAPIGKISPEEAKAAFGVQVDGLLAGGVDLIILETFLDLHEILTAIEAVRERTDLPVVAMMTIDHTGLTYYGRTPEQIGAALAAEDVDVIGLNCSTGPQNILEGVERLRTVTDKPLAAFANAGEPKMIEGRILYLATPEYFAEYTKRMMQHGVRFIGGCCGTGPSHIRLMASAIRALQPRLAGGVEVEEPDRITARRARMEAPEVTVPPRGERSELGRMLDEGSFPVSCEIHPPRSAQVGRILRQVDLLKVAGIQEVNIPDGPRASARMSPMALAHIIRGRTGMDTILHYTCRDRNILGMQSDLLGMQALGQTNVLCVTGDPPKLGDYPMATAVFDVDAIGLLRIASNLNHSRDVAGNPIGRPTSFFLGAGFNPAAIDMAHELDRLHQKVEAGAEYILTQPVFDLERLERALEGAGDLDVPVFVGILPLASHRNAEFFHNEVPGMEVPGAIRERMRAAGDKSVEHAAAEGVSIAREALLAVRNHVQGAYIMPPFGRVELAIDTAAALEGRITADEAKRVLERERGSDEE